MSRKEFAAVYGMTATSMQTIPKGGSETPLRASSVGGPASRPKQKITLLHEGRYWRATVSSSKILQAASKAPGGILEIGRHWTRGGFRSLQQRGVLQEITQEQAMRLQRMLPPAIGTKPQDYKPSKRKQTYLKLPLEKSTVEEIRALSKRIKVPQTRLQREWIRLGLALALDKERSSK